MYLYYKGPLLAFSLGLLTTHMHGSDNDKTPSLIISVRSSSDEHSPGMTPPRHILSSTPVRFDNLQDLPGEQDLLGEDNSDEIPMTAHQLAQQYLSHFEGNTTAALPHLLAVLEADEQAKCYLGHCIHTTTRGGIQPLFVNAKELIHMKTPRGPIKGDFLSDMNSAMPIAKAAVDPIIKALTNTSTQLQTAEKEKADLTEQNTALKTNSNYKAAGWAAVGSIASLLLSWGLSSASSYIGSLTSAPQTIQCILTIANATMGG